MTKERLENRVRVNINISKEAADIIDNISHELGVNKTDVVIGSIRLRRKVRDLIGDNVILATKDASGNLTEIGPLSILE